MADIEHLADAMLQSAAMVLGRLVEQPVAAAGCTRSDRETSIKIDAGTLVTLVDIPSLGIKPVVVFQNADIAKVVSLMLGGMDDADMGAMQLSIVSETVSQVAASMGEALARELEASADGVRAELCTDATNVPPPPFASFAGSIQVGADVSPEIVIDFDGIALSKIGVQTAEEKPELVAAAAPAPAAAAAAPAPRPKAPPRPQTPPPAAQPVAFASMVPTARTGHSTNNLDLVHDVPLQISAVLGRTALTLRDVVTLQSGSVFELDKLSTDPIDLYVNNILIARGEVVVVDDKFAVKISELNPSAD